jgi:hypothetical protein
MRALIFVAALASVAHADEVASVRAFLTQKHPGRRWDEGPTPIDSPAVRAVYPRLRFYRVSSHKPLPPGAYIKETVDAYQRESERVGREMLDAIVSIDNRGRVQAVDWNRGRTTTGTSEPALRATTAAIAAIQGVSVAPAEVTFTRDQGMTYGTALAESHQLVQVGFDDHGRVVSVNAAYVGPMPP